MDSIEIKDKHNVNVCITGGEGYIGTALMTYLAPFVNNIVSYDIMSSQDILNTELLTSYLINNKIDIVIHLAALSSVSACNEDNIRANHINGNGTHSVLQAMYGANCHHIIYASTSSVYGNSILLPYKETNSVVPCSSYGQSKLLGEQEIIDYYSLHNGNYLIFRMFNVIGRLDCSKSSANKAYDRLFGALESGVVNVYGTDYLTKDGTCERDYVSLYDVCRAYLLGIKKIANTCKSSGIREILNICTGKSISVKAIISKWDELSNKKLKITYGHRRMGDPEIVCGDNVKCNEVIGWKHMEEIEDIIAKLVNK